MLTNRAWSSVRIAIFSFTVFLLTTGIWVYATRQALLMGVAQFLAVRDPLEQADAIFLLNGESNLRALRAAVLHKNHLAPLILIARASDPPTTVAGLVPHVTDLSIGVLQRMGVPQKSVIQIRAPKGVTSTADEAQSLHDFAISHPMKRIIVVTSAFHARRTRWIFRKTLEGVVSDVRVESASYLRFNESNWWEDEDGVVTCFNEYIKLIYYMWKY